jgi:hypothetical protein
VLISREAALAAVDAELELPVEGEENFQDALGVLDVLEEMRPSERIAYMRGLVRMTKDGIRTRIAQLEGTFTADVEGR